LGSSGIEEFPAMPPISPQSTPLIHAHKAGIAYHVEGKDRGQPTFHAQSP
jgi:hypothetical protein